MMVCMKIVYDNHVIEFNVQYGKGKKNSIHIDSFGRITLIVPKKTSEETIIETWDLNEEELRLKLKKFYFSSCKKIIGERIHSYQTELRVKPKSIEIVESTTKWGSCSSDKKLTFNYRLAMAPVEVIDYVIIHELCHLLHMNHDRSFWRKVGGLMPDYKEKEAYLTRYSRAMTL